MVNRIGLGKILCDAGTCCENGRCMNSLGVVYIVAAIGCEWLMSMSGDVNVLADFGIRGLD